MKLIESFACPKCFILSKDYESFACAKCLILSKDDESFSLPKMPYPLKN